MDGLTKKPESHLIGSPKTAGPHPSALVLFAVAKSLPFLVVLLASTFAIGSRMTVVLFLGAVASTFWVIKGYCGWFMIGMKWFFGGSDDDSIFSFEFEPPPYIPSFTLSNAFWIGFIVALLLWVASMVVFLFTGRPMLLVFSILGFATDALNLWGFLKGSSRAQKESAQIARSAMLDDSVRFAIITDEHQSSEGAKEAPKHSDSDIV
jgi:hypothetical protein